MSRPKFQSRETRECIELGLEPPGSPWSVQYQRERAEKCAARLPVIARTYFNVDAHVARRLGRLHHEAYLRRTGGMVSNDGFDVHLYWSCCYREELLTEVNYDRHGELRPEDKARILALSYYHRCADA